MSSAAPFKKGDEVEVLIEASDDDAESTEIVTWHPAKVLKDAVGVKGKVFLQFCHRTSPENAYLRERVDFCRVRPVPPPARWRFEVGDRVEVLRGYGWRGGVVEEILENSKYSVKVDGLAEASDVDRWRVRAFREWVDGRWAPEESQKKEMPDTAAKKSKEELETKPTKLAVKHCDRTSNIKFEEGMRVEVSSYERGYEGAYYAANVVGYLGNDRYLVEYLKLRTDDYKEALREEAESRHIRPCPATKLRLNRYRQFEVVDCWYNEGWWKGDVSKVLGRQNYEIYFSATLEKLEFTHGDLRPHQDWTDGRWVKDLSSKEQTRGTNSMLLENTEKLLSDTSRKRLKFKFSEGTNVEIKHEVPGLHGSFFLATIIDSLPNEYYAVQYHNWKTADGKYFLKQEMHASCIRPYPPNVCKDAYCMHDLVEAWLSDQWQIGCVTRVFGDSNYEFYFNDSKERIILGHGDMRPHQEWLDEKWVDASIGPLCEVIFQDQFRGIRQPAFD